jgi:hypothetical protein
VRSAFTRQIVEEAMLALEIWPGISLALPHAAEAEGAATRASALAESAAAAVKRSCWR